MVLPATEVESYVSMLHDEIAMLQQERKGALFTQTERMLESAKQAQIFSSNEIDQWQQNQEQLYRDNRFFGSINIVTFAVNM